MIHSATKLNSIKVDTMVYLSNRVDLLKGIIAFTKTEIV